jgi:hypothetical protein
MLQSAIPEGWLGILRAERVYVLRHFLRTAPSGKLLVLAFGLDGSRELLASGLSFDGPDAEEAFTGHPA